MFDVWEYSLWRIKVWSEKLQSNAQPQTCSGKYQFRLENVHRIFCESRKRKPLLKSWWAATISASQLQKIIILNSFSLLWTNLIIFKNYPVNWHQRQNRRASLFRKNTQLTCIEEIIGRNEWIRILFGNIGWNLNEQLSRVVHRSIFHANSSHSSVIFVPTNIVEIKCRSAQNTFLPKEVVDFRQLQNSNGKEFETRIMNVIILMFQQDWTSFQSFGFKSI